MVWKGRGREGTHKYYPSKHRCHLLCPLHFEDQVIIAIPIEVVDGFLSIALLKVVNESKSLQQTKRTACHALSRAQVFKKSSNHFCVSPSYGLLSGSLCKWRQLYLTCILDWHQFNSLHTDTSFLLASYMHSFGNLT